MSTFTFTSGNPNNLTAGATASMADIQGPFVDLRTFINGSLDETNVPNLNAAFTTYKAIAWAGGVANETIVAGAGTYLLWAAAPGNAGTQNIPGAAGSANSAMAAFFFNPADWTANTRTTNMRLRVFMVTNAVAPTASFTFGLYPVSAFGGASGANPTIATLGTVITNSTVTITSPGATTQSAVLTSDFVAPAAGSYAVAFASTGAMTANSRAAINVQIQMKQV